MNRNQTKEGIRRKGEDAPNTERGRRKKKRGRRKKEESGGMFDVTLLFLGERMEELERKRTRWDVEKSYQRKVMR